MRLLDTLTQAASRARTPAPLRRVVPAARPMARRVTDDTDWYVAVGLGVLALGSAALLARAMAARNRRRHVEDVMVRDVVTVDAQASILEAAQRMRDDNVGVLPLVEGGRLIGVVTDRDLVVRALARGADPSATRVRDCASTTVVAARPRWRIDEAMRVMSECQIGRLPVIDGERRLVGIVTLSSLALRSPEDTETLETAQEVSRRSARVA